MTAKKSIATLRPVRENNFCGVWCVLDYSFPKERQVFVSKSGHFKEVQEWAGILQSNLGNHFNLITDNYFRPLAADQWVAQFIYTRASHAMLVLLDPEEWTSHGQDVEIEDALGRGMPVALCRTGSFAARQFNESFKKMLVASDNQNAPRSFVAYFDFYERDLKLELSRLNAWMNRFAAPPLKIPDLFVAGQPQLFREAVRVPEDGSWKWMNWSQHSPLLVFNYGNLLVQHTDRIPRPSQPKQIIVPLASTGVPGEVTAEIVLASGGSGHAVLTIGQPATNYVWDDGGLNVSMDQRNDLFLWWDFRVYEPR